MENEFVTFASGLLESVDRLVEFKAIFLWVIFLVVRQSLHKYKDER
jgi:hypothetical protein